MPKPSRPPKLSEVARKVTAPDGIVSTMWPAVESTCRLKLGLTFDPWQDQCGRLALAKRADGKLAAMVDGVGLSICRQAGKTHWLTGLVFGVSIIRPNTLTIWSAHHAKTHGETFLAMRVFASRHRVDPFIEQVFTGAGTEEIRFRNGSRILFGAREHGFGRGIPGVDIIVADEAQIMSEKAVDAQTATMNTSDFGLMFYIGTPPRPDDNSEAFSRMRTLAWEGKLTDGVWIEFGAEPGSDPAAPATWRRANPSHPHRTPAESILRLMRKLTPDSFLREGLGIWPEEALNPFTTVGWSASKVTDPDLTTTMALGVHANLERSRVSFLAAIRMSNGGVLLEDIPAECSMSGVPRRVKELADRWKPTEVVIHGSAAAASLITAVEALGVRVKTTGASDMAKACGQIYDLYTDGQLHHIGQKRLTDSALSARWKTRGETRVWDWKNEQIDPWIAATLAVHGLVGVANTAKHPQVHEWPAELLEGASW